MNIDELANNILSENSATPFKPFFDICKTLEEYISIDFSSITSTGEQCFHKIECKKPLKLNEDGSSTFPAGTHFADTETTQIYIGKQCGENTFHLYPLTLEGEPFTLAILFLNIYMYENLTVKQKNTIKSFIRNEKPNLFYTMIQSQGLNSFSKARTKKLKTDAMGNAAVKVSENFLLFMPNYTKTGEILPSTLQTLDCFLIWYTNNPTDAAKVTMPLSEFMKMRDITSDAGARKIVLDSMSQLENVKFQAREKINGKWKKSGTISICGGTAYIQNSTIFFNFNMDFYNYLQQLSERNSVMQICSDGIKINSKKYPHAYFFNRYIAENWRMNEGQRRVYVVTVKTLLAKTPSLPTIEDVQTSNRRYFDRIIRPVINNLDALPNCYCDFLTDNDEIIEDPLTYFKGRGGIDKFMNSKIKIDYDDYPSNPERITQKRKRKADAEKAKNIAIAKSNIQDTQDT